MASSYQRMFLGYSPPISQAIIEHSRETSSKSIEVLPITVVSESQVKEALSHPHNTSLKEMIDGPYTEFMRANREIIKEIESLENQFVTVKVTLGDLEESKRATKSEATKKVIENVQSSLNQQWKFLNTIKDSLDHQRAQLSETEESFKMVSKHDSEWSQYREEQLDKLSLELQKSLHIPQEEINNLLRQDLPDLMVKFTDRVMVTQDMPPAKLDKLVGLKKPDFVTYFKMKAYLAIRSVLPSSERVPQYMEMLEDLFKQMQIDGEKLHNIQSEEIKSLQTNKVEPILEVAQENYKILTRMEADRMEQIKTVTNIDTIITKVDEEIQRSTKPAKGPG